MLKENKMLAINFKKLKSRLKIKFLALAEIAMPFLICAIPYVILIIAYVLFEKVNETLALIALLLGCLITFFAIIPLVIGFIVALLTDLIEAKKTWKKGIIFE